MSKGLSLRNKWIVITRPVHQANTLSKKLEMAGANIIQFPLIGIKPPHNLDAVKYQLNNLYNYDLIIFISANAVEQCFTLVESEIFNSLKVASTGRKTAQVLDDYGVIVDFYPKQFFNSEALLEIPELQEFSEGKNIAIIRGQGGREYLREGLIKMGANVDYIDVYIRYFPQSSLIYLKQFWKRKELDLVLLTSGSSVSNFFKLLENDSWANELTLLLGSHRMQQKIPAQFQGKILIAEDPSDETLYKKLTTEYG